MEAIANFSKVSYEQFYEDHVKHRIECYHDASATGENHDKYHSIVKPLYGNLPLPKRATTGSAGYDFVTPSTVTVNPGDTVTIPTGIRVKIDEGWVLMIFPRSSLGFKYNTRLVNTVGIIDSDYYNADNEGHIMIKIINNSDSSFTLNKYDRFAQGIFLPYGITVDDSATGKRSGGMGSTGQN